MAWEASSAALSVRRLSAVALLLTGAWAAAVAPPAADVGALPEPALAGAGTRVHGSEVRAAAARTTLGPAPGHGTPIGCDGHGAAVRHSGSRHRHWVALTFDDGPWPDTAQFLAVLEREHVPATFFLIGRQVPGHEDLLRRMLRDGDAIGNHTLTHPDLRRLSAGGVRHQLSAASDTIHRAVGYRPCLFRPPYGSYNATVVASASARRMTTVVWDVDPRDWSRPGTAAIERRVRAQTRSGSVLLMHDGGGPRAQTLAALPRVIRALRRRGMRFVTVADMFGFRLRRRP